MNTTWIEIEPVDTLFFRGAEAMEAGEDHQVDTMFPPMPSTLIGAVRTAILRQGGISPRDYLEQPDRWQEKIPFLGPPEQPGFSLLGPLFITENNCPLLPVPAHWFADLPESGRMEWGKSYPVTAAKAIAKAPLGLTGSVGNPFWVYRPCAVDLKSLAGYWASPAAFRALATGKTELPFFNDPCKTSGDEAFIVPQSALYDREERVGIALTRQRCAKDGHLYGTVHVRLRPGLKLLAGLVSEHKLPLDERGIIQLGGEQRVCAYREIDVDLDISKNCGLLYSLSPLAFDELPDSLHKRPRSSGKLLRIGGWDMKKRFHKPMTAWLPAGMVIAADYPVQLPQFIQI